MAKKKEQEEPKGEELFVSLSEVPRIKSPNFVSVYANNTNLATGFFDLRFVFSEIMLDPGQESTVKMEDRVAVTMSWEQGKAVLKMLQRKIDDYERENGASVREHPNASE